VKFRLTGGSSNEVSGDSETTRWGAYTAHHPISFTSQHRSRHDANRIAACATGSAIFHSRLHHPILSVAGSIGGCDGIQTRRLASICQTTVRLCANSASGWACRCNTRSSNRLRYVSRPSVKLHLSQGGVQ
jgi:hypothetical protein